MLPHLTLRNRKSSTTSSSGTRVGVQDDHSLESSTPSLPQQQQSPAEDQSNRKTIAIDTQTLRKSVRFQPAKLQGESIILIDAVRIGSSAETLGLKPGQRLVAISDPIQGPDVVWDIQDNTSLRFVMDAIRVTTSRTTVIAVQDPDPTQPAPRPLREGGYDADRSFQPSQVDSNVRKRIQAREDMLETIGQRNDVPFLVSLAAGLILPGFFGLLIAYLSGYEFLK
eukprot:CAMPEP_0185259332 /NCGR_PEP_ID=MMETSP1359-20130426/8123_1 /TAXON_ID=552665 /ORGANISM="Bigelowiella longifila, Strain CCMP242" /LENGTH=224 /DNA_ID=CAMNT_0027845197 /DNA_START=228 /DNA_END=902 /DNA_ORIENTATION=+